MPRPPGTRLHTQWGKTRRIVRDLILMGHTEREICYKLSLHPDTYRMHVKKIRSDILAVDLDTRIMVLTEELYQLLAEKKAQHKETTRDNTDTPSRLPPQAGQAPSVL